MFFKKNPLQDLTKRYDEILKINESRLKEIGHSEDAKRCWLFFISAEFELLSFKELFVKYVIPAAEVSVSNMRSAIRDMRMTDIEFFGEDFIEHNYQAVLQEAYVTLWHKYELFSKSITQMMYGVKDETEIKKIREALKKQYGFPGHKGEDRSETLKEIQWICNSIKHHGGFPCKADYADTPICYIGQKKDVKVHLSKERLVEHIDFMGQYYSQVFEILASIQAFEILRSLENKNLIVPEVEPLIKALELNCKTKILVLKAL